MAEAAIARSGSQEQTRRLAPEGAAVHRAVSRRVRRDDALSRDPAADGAGYIQFIDTHALDYPSQRSGRQFPAEATLLDTCLLQHLKLVMDTICEHGEYMSDEVEHLLLNRYPAPLGPELVALGDLLLYLEHSGPPWVVSESSLIEFEQHNGEKGWQLRRWWKDWADYFDACVFDGWYPGVDVDGLVLRRPPAIAEGQLALPVGPAQWPLSIACVPEFAPFPNVGDRALIRDALRAGIPTILTTDLNSFWRHRCALFPLGIEIWRPTDLWKTLLRETA